MGLGRICRVLGLGPFGFKVPGRRAPVPGSEV